MDKTKGYIDLTGMPKGVGEKAEISVKSTGLGMVSAKSEDGQPELSILDYIGCGGVEAADTKGWLDSNSDTDIIVNINSPGGSVFEGIAIYNLLASHSGSVVVNILGVAASAASIIAMAADTINMHTSSQLMIHRAWTVAVGNSEELLETASFLDRIDSSLADVYFENNKSLTKDDLLVMMAEETWMTADQAIENGFNVNKITKKETNKPKKEKADQSEKAINDSLSSLLNKLKGKN